VLLLRQLFARVNQLLDLPLEKRISPVPDEAISSLSELLNWLTSYGRQGNPAEHRNILDQAYQLFASKDDVVGLLLAWAAAAETYLFDGSDASCVGLWLRRFEERLSNGWSFAGTEMESRITTSMARLCVTALEHEVEVPYVQELIRRWQIKPEISPVHLDHWPWPLRIHTLGRFSLVRDGISVRFSGKVQQKPLELLKILIAFGGRNVAEGRLCEELWPNASDDDAHKAFVVTLHRLRRLLADDRFILYSEGKVTLNPELCWVDTWAFARLSVQAKPLLHSDGDPPLLAIRAGKRAVEYYSGHFLAADSVSPWAISLRESLRSRMHQLVSSLGHHREKSGEWRTAVDLYLKGLETDELVEEFYQRLMLCHRNQGDHGTVYSVYNRCRLALARHGIKPSPTTRAVYEASIESGGL